MNLRTPLLALALAVVPSAFAQFAFFEVDSGDNSTRVLTGAPALNNAGQIAYQADIIGNGSALYLYSGGNVSTLADTSSGFDFIGRYPTINQAGQVGFAANDLKGNSVVYRADGAQLNRIMGPDDNFDFIDFFPSIDSAGRVAFRGEVVKGNEFVDGIYAGDGSAAVAPIYDDHGFFESFGGAPSLNDSGQVAFTGTRSSDHAITVSVGDGVNTTVVADNTDQFNGGFSSFDDKIDLNNSGDIAFGAFKLDGTVSLNLFHNGTVQAIADTSGQFSWFNSYAINESGEMAFVADLDDGTNALFAGSDLTQPILKSGDTLFGKTVFGTGLFRDGLNDNGQLAFYAFFEDGSSSLVFAQVVPEPVTLAIFAPVLWFALRKRRS